ncbi:MAG: NAD(P)-dependent oxidoreductase [Actinomycetia bacterium]|nr:NAD(P)-dependent oxidoreductase [Actinomycetes bacterium]
MSELAVGFIGLGDMGGAMAERILEGGLSLTVFDVRPDAVDALVAKGAKPAAGVPELARASDVVLVCVIDDRQVLEVVRTGLAGNLRAGSVVVVASSVRPETIHDVVALVGEGIDVVDAPVAGSRPAVAAGTLTLMLGGDPAVIARVQPVLDTFGGRVFHCGGHGAGQAMKIANNIMLHMNHLVALEAVRFARSQGIDEITLLEVVNTGSGRSWVTETWGLIDDMFRDHPQAGTPGIYDMMVKEMWNAVVLSKATQTSLPLTGLGVQVGKSLLVERERTLGIVPAEERS